MTCAIGNGTLNLAYDNVDNDELWDMLEEAVEELTCAVAVARQSERHENAYHYYLEVAAEVGKRRFMSAMLH